jgi:hypothetical protein
VSAMDRIESAAEKPDIHSDIPCPIYFRCPVSLVVSRSMLQVLLPDYVPQPPYFAPASFA